MLRLGALRRYCVRLHDNAADDTSQRAAASAIVFAPHQDDESLGCGGTMALKSQSGTPFDCVFMTDGTTSHSTFIDPAELKALRKAEALEATAVLGLTPERVHFFDFPDSVLANHHAAAVDRVAALLASRAPEEIYVPYRRDGTPDHEATYRIVIAALAKVGRPVQVLEYPVWFWNQWPWVSVHLAPNRATLNAIQRAAGSGFGRELLTHFTSGVRVRPFLERKRAALACHRSQMTRLNGDARWPILADVSDGEFLQCSFQDIEVFRRTSVNE